MSSIEAAADYREAERGRGAEGSLTAELQAAPGSLIYIGSHETMEAVQLRRSLSIYQLRM